MDNYTDPVALAKKLISLPSYVNAEQDERPLTDFLSGWLAQALSEMTVEKQYIEGSKRYNILVKGSKAPRLFVLGHLDTVQPKIGWQTNPLVPTVKDGRLYGLGAADMKSSLAAFLATLVKLRTSVPLSEVTLLMYVDEEYEFKGMRRFLENIDIAPELTLSLDGALEVATGCRGLIELRLLVRGKSGHASNPSGGLNAISGSIGALQEVTADLAIFSDKALGDTTANIAAIRGGVLQKTVHGDEWLQNANVIADTTEIVFEVRPATSEINAQKLVAMLERALTQRGLQLEEVTVCQDIAPWDVVYDAASERLFKNAYKDAGVKFQKDNQRLKGYIDAEMLVREVPAPTYIIGTGGTNKHGANESVPLESIQKATAVYDALLREIL